MRRDISPIENAQVGALNVSFEALENYLLNLGTQLKRGKISEHTYNSAEASISADMKVLSDKYEAITGEPLSLFTTI